MRNFALTYPQLMGQAMALGLPDDDLGKLRRGYDLGERLFDGFYTARGEPQISHVVRSSAIVLAEDRPADVAAAALVHAAYRLHQFRGSSRQRVTPRHRREVAAAVGPQAEAIAWAYEHIAWYRREAIEAHRRELPRFDANRRGALAIRLANELEEHLDLGRAYGTDYPLRERIRDVQEHVVALAGDLGMPTLADELATAYREHLERDLPEAVRRRHATSYELPSRRMWEMNVIQRGSFELKRSVSRTASGARLARRVRTWRASRDRA